MKYIVRVNIRAFNPLTMKMDPRRFWEIEQTESKDSQKVIWHCAHVRIRHGQFAKETPIEDYLATEMALRKQEKTAKNQTVKKEKAKPIEFVFQGLVLTSGSDDALVIQEGKHDVFA